MLYDIIILHAMFFAIQLDDEAVQSYIEQLWNMFLCPNIDNDVDQYRHNLIDQVITILSAV